MISLNAVSGCLVSCKLELVPLYGHGLPNQFCETLRPLIVTTDGRVLIGLARYTCNLKTHSEHLQS